MSKNNVISLISSAKRGLFVVAAIIVPTGIVALGGCAAMPMAPKVMALPGTGKSFEQFRA